MPSALDVVTEFIAAFVAAWPQRDAASLRRFFRDDAVYCNGPLPPVEGGDSIIETITEFMQMGGDVDVDLVHVLSDGLIVMTERIDRFRKDGATASMPMMGILEVRDGAIAAWRDYFDLAQFTTQL
ncbi:MAG: limonene-1,2-epoxide hydrolase family protein [Actinomycetes bacterium]